MFRNYLKTAWRNLKANKLFAVLNITGLALGLGVCILLFAYVSHEWSFDRMYPNARNIYRINLQTGIALDSKKFTTIPNAVWPALLESIPQIKASTRLIKDGFGAPASLKAGDNIFLEKGLYLADASIFKIFSFDFIQGNAQTAFAHPHSIVLSSSAKERLFGNLPAIGKIIRINDREDLYVTGIYKDLPDNSSIDCHMIYNIMDSWMGKELWWSNPSYETYCLLEPGSNIATIEQQANNILYQNIGDDTIYYKHLFFQPLDKIHLYSSDLREGYSSRLGDIRNVKTLFFLSFLVLLIACVNYMNLATARYQKRSKEVGVNKVLAIPLAWLAMNKWLQNFAYRIDISWWVFAVAGLLAIMIALITVSWQAIRAARANPVKSLRTE